MREIRDTFQIRLSGVGGQGLVLGSRVLAEALVLENRTVAQSQSYEPVSRGGISRSDLVVGSEAIDYPLVTALDLLIVLDQVAIPVSEHLINGQSIVLLDAERVTSPPRGAVRWYSLPLTGGARVLGDTRVTNMLALGAGVALSEVCELASLEQAARAQMAQRFWDISAKALYSGHDLGLAALKKP